MSAPAETALIVPVPEAEPLVGRHRRILDHSAPWGVPAHVTVLYPFLPPDRVTGEAIEDVRGCLTAVEAFSCTFSDVRWFGEDAVWLAHGHGVRPARRVAGRRTTDSGTTEALAADGE